MGMNVDGFLQKEVVDHASRIELIASENFISDRALKMLGSIFANRLSEGYVFKRCNTGCRNIDEIEKIAVDRAKKLFGCGYANIQPHSGSQANQAIFLGLLKPGDKILSMSLDAGGHLTHGLPSNFSGMWFKPVHYNVDKNSYLIDYNMVEDLAKKHKPKLIIAGYSSYTRELDFKAFRLIADRVGAYFLADIAHIAGIIAAERHENPINYADVVTSTTHKTLRGPRGGMILSNNTDLFKTCDVSLFPGIQSAPLVNVIAAKAVSLGEALGNNYKSYIDQVLKNSKALSETLLKRGFDLLTGGTDNHIVMLNLSKNNITGKVASEMLALAGITCNKNLIPYDNNNSFHCSGLRFGTAACTSRGLKEEEVQSVGNIIADILEAITEDDFSPDAMVVQNSRTKVSTIASRHIVFK